MSFSVCKSEEQLENDEAATEMIWDPLLRYLFAQPSFHRRKQMDHIFIFADGQSARVWDSYDLVRSEAIFMMVEHPARIYDFLDKLLLVSNTFIFHDDTVVQ